MDTSADEEHSPEQAERVLALTSNRLPFWLHTTHKSPLSSNATLAGESSPELATHRSLVRPMATAAQIYHYTGVKCSHLTHPE
jgi:hypothetical protein